VSAACKKSAQIRGSISRDKGTLLSISTDFSCTAHSSPDDGEVQTSETLINLHQSIWCYNPQDNHLKIYLSVICTASRADQARKRYPRLAA
jgi:hypothetical protein